MNQKTIALVFMADEQDSFFIENPPEGPPAEWVHNRVSDIKDVEYVEVFMRGPRLHAWSNPNCCPES